MRVTILSALWLVDYAVGQSLVPDVQIIDAIQSIQKPRTTSIQLLRPWIRLTLLLSQTFRHRRKPFNPSFHKLKVKFRPRQCWDSSDRSVYKMLPQDSSIRSRVSAMILWIAGRSSNKRASALRSPQPYRIRRHQQTISRSH